ncbi:MAG: glycosyltransferase family 4 protein [Thermoleophilia bacterium]|nr:glycosyltransferase family 4 protein [Thermoleophilia bacterium]
MRILFLISTLGLGGAEKQLVSWAKILQDDLGARISVASFDATLIHRARTLRDMDVPVQVLGRDMSLPRRVSGVVSMAKQNRVDVVHAFSCYLSPLAVAAALAVRATPASSFRGSGQADLRGLRTIYRQPVLSVLRYFTANSHEAITLVRHQLSQKALLHYVPNLVTDPGPESRRQPAVEREGSVTALMVGRLDENKRIDVFLEALAKARRMEPRLKGLIVGEGPVAENLRNRATVLGLMPDGIEFTGQVPDVSEYYRGAGMLVHLAVSEGTPNVVLEAVAAGVPVITTSAGDLRRIVRPGQTGVLVPFDDSPAVARSLVESVRSPERSMRMAERARDEVLQSHSKEMVREALRAFYSAVVPV